MSVVSDTRDSLPFEDYTRVPNGTERGIPFTGLTPGPPNRSRIVKMGRLLRRFIDLDTQSRGLCPLREGSYPWSFQTHPQWVSGACFHLDTYMSLSNFLMVSSQRYVNSPSYYDSV